MAKARPISQFDLDGNFLNEFATAKLAAISVGLKSHSGIIGCCQLKDGCRQTAGYQWRYSDSCENQQNIGPVRKLGEVFKEKYGKGSDGYMSVREKNIETSLNKYGEIHPMKNEKVRDSLKQSVLTIYGVDNAAKNVEVKIKISESERKTKSQSFIDNFTESNNFIGLSDEDVFEFRSKNCDHTFFINRQLLSLRHRNVSTICTICNPPEVGKVSEVEKSLASMITWTEVQTNVTGLVQSRHELDIYLEIEGIGIEVNGIKFHSDAYGKGESYHINKTRMFGDIGISVLHFFDDEIIEKPDLVLDMIRSKCGVSERIGARKCVVRQIPNPSQFLNDNHLQGNVNSKIAYGLFHQDELVACMTFGNLRRSLGYKSSEGDWELIRFCNKKGYVVVGGASKLFKHFIENHKPNSVVSYANLRWSSGDMYRKLGFAEDGMTRPGYFYFWKNRRVHRYTLRKSELIKMGYDPLKTESEIIEELGIPKIYDCGNIRFIWKCSVD